LVSCSRSSLTDFGERRSRPDVMRAVQGE
jgi:hypothetical protein